MLDAAEPGGGIPFDWDLVGDLASRHRILLAGGLRPDNVAEAIRRVQPWGVDVASGVERAPGQKDARAIARFVTAARSAGGP
jgi:phosphoribosylanthranilate isomerase